MFDQTDRVNLLLKPFGLTGEEIKIYLNLLENNELSALSISRNLHIGRGRVYRILDRLIEKQMVVQQYDEIGFKFRANDPSQLKLLLEKRENEIISLKEKLPETLEILNNLVGTNKPGSKVLYYRGRKGILQVNWNLLNTKGEFLSYEVSNAEAYMSHEEAEKLRQGLMDKKIYSRTLRNLPSFKIDSGVKGLESLYQIRSIPVKILEIRADIFIYNDIFAICHYLDDGDIFCLEMKNEYLVKMQREIFENLWQQAK